MLRKLAVGLITVLGLITFSPPSHLSRLQCLAQEVVAATDILKEAKARHVPTESYTVNVVQRILAWPNSVAGTPNVAAQSAAEVDSGVARFVPGEGLRREHSPGTESESEQGAIKIMVDLGAFLEELISYPNATTQLVELNGRTQILVQGSDSQRIKELKIWIDQERTRVSRLQLSIENRPFALLDMTYAALQNGYWLPASIEVRHFTDDSRVALDFSGHVFSK